MADLSFCVENRVGRSSKVWDKYDCKRRL